MDTTRLEDRRADESTGKENDSSDIGSVDLVRRQLYEAERQQRIEAEARAERNEDQAEYYKKLLALREAEVRYRLGDAFVRAARPSIDTLKLPFRLVGLFIEGLRRAWARRLGGATEPPSSADGEAHSAYGPIDLMSQPYSIVQAAERRRDDVCIAAVTDEFSWWAWQFEADVYTFRPEAWREAMEARPPDMLLVESTWHGLDNSWYFQLRQFGERGEVSYALPEIASWCRKRGIPTVFYNKEDPPNFDVFIECAKQCDHVFTSDANCIPEYRRRLGHDRIHALPFAAQPRIHNPVMVDEVRRGSVCFAGTWYAERHKNRQADAASILRPALEYDLHVFDRMADRGDAAYAWPAEYRRALRGAVPYRRMLSQYKRYKVFLNVNSVKDSPSMFSRRVFELLACGTPVISSRSRGIEELLGSDIVLMSEAEATTRAMLERLLADEDYRDRLSLRGQRKVFDEHTYTHRLQSMLDAVGLERPGVKRPTMTMIAAVETEEEIRAALENFQRQAFSDKRLILCARRPALLRSLEDVAGRSDRVGICARDGAPWERVLSDALAGCPGGFVAALRPRDYYGKHYLADYANAVLFVVEPAIGKARWYKSSRAGALDLGSGAEYRVVGRVNPLTLCVRLQDAVRAAAKVEGAASPEAWWQRMAQAFPAIYSSDRFNYVESADGGDALQFPALGLESDAVVPRWFEPALV